MTAPRDRRLPGSLAEVRASPPGPKIGAFFDMDGTLVAGFTGVMLTRDRLLNRDMGVGELLATILAALSLRLGRLQFEGLIDKVGGALRGRPLADLDQVGERLFRQQVQGRIYPEMRALVRAHLARGHTVVLSSSALTIQVEPVARFLGIPATLTNRFELDLDGMLTGGIVKPLLWGPGKAAAVQRFAAEHDVELAESYFYADGNEDVALMYLVGNPRPTSPEARLAAVAKKRGWPILRFTSRGGGGLLGPLRTAAGVGALLPVAAGAVGVGLLAGSRRRGVNFFTSNWPQLLLAAGGVRVNVHGADNLNAARPAVFLFNHRNNFDPLIAASLIRDNFTSVAKKELESDLLVGNLGRIIDAAFIDRDDPHAALEGLAKIEELARQGISVLIAPEGTRLDTTEVGEFKKGPFRIAMSVGIPVVPIVIRNAEEVASRDSSTLNPGTVDVAVLPPISVADWDHDDLPERIEEVRRLYLDTLREWPSDDEPA